MKVSTSVKRIGKSELNVPNMNRIGGILKKIVSIVEFTKNHLTKAIIFMNFLVFM